MLRSVFSMIALGCMVVASASVAFSDEKSDATLGLVPRPAEIELKPGSFTLKASTSLLVSGWDDGTKVAKQLAHQLKRSTGLALIVLRSSENKTAHDAILFTRKADPAVFGPEGYQLDVTPDGIVIAASDGSGLFYGMQTLLQLLPPEVFSPKKAEGVKEWKIPAVHIVDQPRFHWRGLLLDLARHFLNKDELENFIDLMAQHKLNVLQLHLVDDQGWRIEIKKYPKLAKVGGWRKGIDFGLDPKSSTAYGPDGQYGGFLTQDEVREIVAYAKERYITVVPEIEMPGHSAAGLSAYPEFSCIGKPYDRDSGEMGIYCPGNDEAFTFLEGVLSEIIDLFPSKYIHIGGDEVDKTNWTKCPKCQARIKKEGLKDVNELQSYFIKRIEKFINAKGRTMIGWDEILEGGLAPNAVVMSWRGMDGGIAAANAGHDVVMTPTSHCYFDYSQAAQGEPRNIGSLITLEKVYSFEPVPGAIAPDKVKHILGGGANLWSEFFPNYAHVQYMAYPRACALAETTWTDPKLKQWDDFSKRLDVHLKRLKVQGVNYRKREAL